MVKGWTVDQSNQITDLYKQLRGTYEREAHQKLFGGPELPYLEAFNALTSLIEKQKKEQVGGLEGKVKNEATSGGILSSQRLKYAVGLGAVIALVLGVSPYIP